MTQKDIVLYSPIALEKWTYSTPDTVGIGGSETAHVELAYLFGKKMFHTNIISYAPCERKELGPGNVQWIPIEDYEVKENQIWLVFRDPFFFEKEENIKKGNKYYFIAQDVDYSWTDERLSRVDKYICLCKEHARFTLQQYPQLKDRIFISTNGIRSDLIRMKIKNQTQKRKPKRLIYSSSPDRGLELLLDNFFRITEKHPDVKLDVYYGFNNLKVIAERNKDFRLSSLYTKLMRKQNELKEWVTFYGRINQNQLYEEMLTSSVWPYFSDWPETSCITCMEMQACGVYPIVNNHWAQGENVLNGIVLDGIPQKDPLVKCSLFKELNNFLEIDGKGFEEEEKIRKMLSEDALDSFSWDKVSSQYLEWFKNE